MSNEQSSATSPAAIAAMLHYISVDIQKQSPVAADIVREAALELEAHCREQELQRSPNGAGLSLNGNSGLHGFGHA